MALAAVRLPRVEAEGSAASPSKEEAAAGEGGRGEGGAAEEGACCSLPAEAALLLPGPEGDEPWRRGRPRAAGGCSNMGEGAAAMASSIDAAYLQAGGGDQCVCVLKG